MSAPAIMLPITLTMAGAATLLNLWLGQRVGKMRVAHRVSIGDGGQEPLITRMRAQANYVEYTPFFLILLALIELAAGSQLWLWTWRSSSSWAGSCTCSEWISRLQAGFAWSGSSSRC